MVCKKERRCCGMNEIEQIELSRANFAPEFAEQVRIAINQFNASYAMQFS